MTRIAQFGNDKDCSCFTAFLLVGAQGLPHWCQLKTRATGSRGYKNQVRLRGLMKNQGFWNLRGALRAALALSCRFCLCSCGFNRPIPLKLTPMSCLTPLRLPRRIGLVASRIQNWENWTKTWKFCHSQALWIAILPEDKYIIYLIT